MTRLETTAPPATRAPRDWTDFVARIHATLELDAVAYVIVNEARRLVSCDRVSLAIVRGGKAELLAVSGQDTFDRRANLVRAVEQLCDAAIPGCEPVWHGENDPPRAPQIELPLTQLLDVSHARRLVALPLTTDGAPSGELLGWLIAERFDVEQSADDFRTATTTAAAHSAPALANALRYHRLPLRRTGEALDRLARGRLPSKTMFASGVAAVVAALLVFVPADLKIEAHGTLQPRERRHVFAPDDGLVTEVLVRHGDTVAARQPLVKLINPSLELEWTRIAGELNKVDQEILSVEAKRLGNAQPATASPTDLTAELVRLKQLRDGLSRQHLELSRRRESMTILAPLAGRVLTWDVENQLAGRPVQKGQLLLTVGNVAGPWELELRVRDEYVGHVRAARHDGAKPAVKFISASEAQTTHAAELDDVALRSEPDEEGRAVVRAAALVTGDMPGEELRPGAVVAAKIDCGRASLGYVWLIDFIQMFRTRVMF